MQLFRQFWRLSMLSAVIFATIVPSFSLANENNPSPRFSIHGSSDGTFIFIYNRTSLQWAVVTTAFILVISGIALPLLAIIDFGRYKYNHNENFKERSYSRSHNLRYVCYLYFSMIDIYNTFLLSKSFSQIIYVKLIVSS